MSSILRQITVLNGILLAGILAFGYFLLVPIFTVEVKVPASSGTAVNAAEPKREQTAEQVANPPMQDYAVISEKNLFHPDRIIPAEKKEAEIPRPEFVLYGTLISDNVRLAYLIDKKAPRTTPGRGKRQVGLKIGETLSGYTLKEVLPDRAVLMRGDDRIELKVISPESKKDRGGAEGGTIATPGGRAVQPPMPMPGSPQATPPPSMMPGAQTGQVPSVQQSPMTSPLPVGRSRRAVGR